MASSMAMRRAAAAATTTTTPFTLFTKLITSRAAAAAAARSSFSTTAKSPPSAASNDDDCGPITVKGPPQKFKMENPFQLGGPANVVEVDEVKDVGTLVRVALPGVGPDGIKVWAENNTVFFAGKGEMEQEGEESRRKYGGSLEFSPELNRVDGFKAEMVNGILRLVVPNADKQG